MGKKKPTTKHNAGKEQHIHSRVNSHSAIDPSSSHYDYSQMPLTIFYVNSKVAPKTILIRN